MRQIVIDIDAGERECGRCDHLIDRDTSCWLWGDITDYRVIEHQGHVVEERPLRLPACLEAEAEAKRIAGKEGA